MEALTPAALIAGDLVCEALISSWYVSYPLLLSSKDDKVLPSQ